MKFESMGKTSLAVLPTPLQYMPNLSEKLGVGKLYIKRDDLTTVGLSGNKIRKLEYLIHDAKKNDYTTLLTYGGEQTNHGRLTAAAAVKSNMKSILVLGGKEPEYYSGNLVLDKLLGADVYFTEGDRSVLAKEIIKKYEIAGEKVYEIPVGASNELGTLGYFDMVKELKEQFEMEGINPKYLVVGVGSLGTFAGLWLGAKYYGANFEIIPISVDPEPSYTEAVAEEYINRASKYLGLDIQCDKEELKWVYQMGEENFSGTGYNVPDRQTQEAIKLLASTEAIFTDPCYSGKVLHGFIEICKHNLKKEESAVFLHTGGIPAIWTKEHLDSMQEMLKV